MIEVINNGDIVTLEDPQEPELYQIVKLNKPLKIKPNSRYVIKTGLTVSCTKPDEYIWVKGAISDDRVEDIPHIMLTEYYSIEDGVVENVELVGFYGAYGQMGTEKTITIPAGADIAHIYHMYSKHNDNCTLARQTDYLIYADEQVTIMAEDGKQRDVMLDINSDGTKILKVDLTEKE